MINFQPTSKAISVIGLIQILIIFLGILISGMEIKMWKLRFPYEMFEQVIPPPSLFVFLAYYGIILFLIPLVWSGTSLYLYHYSGTSNRIQIPIYYGGYIIIIGLFIFILYALIAPWGDAPHGITMAR